MVEAADKLNQSEILAGFVGSTPSLPLRIQILTETASTNTEALHQGRQGAPEGTVVFAEKQTAGRGRSNRTWDSPPFQNLYFSILLRPSVPPEQCSPLTLIAGLACHDVMKEYLKEDLRLKWPNDLWVKRKKLGGVMAEMEARTNQPYFVVVGIGVNINSPKDDFSKDVAEIATSLLMETGKTHPRSKIAGALLSTFFQRYQTFLKEGFAPLKSQWESVSKMKGEKVKVKAADRSFEGICEGIDEMGFLLVKTKSGAETVAAGDVTWV